MQYPQASELAVIDDRGRCRVGSSRKARNPQASQPAARQASRGSPGTSAWRRGEVIAHRFRAGRPGRRRASGRVRGADPRRQDPRGAPCAEELTTG